MTGRPSRQAQLVGLALRGTVRPIIDLWSVAPWLPWPYRVVDHAGRLVRHDRDVTFQSVDLPRCRAQWITPREIRRDIAVLYLPGGAFLAGGWYLHRHMLARMATEIGAPVLAVDYRKLPAHRLADSIDDAVDAYRYLIDSGREPAGIVVAGDSAGGFLGLVLPEVLQRRRWQGPAAIIAMSPLLDLDKVMRGPGCAVLSARAVRALARLSHRGATHPLPTPLAVASERMPPVLVQVAGRETLVRQARAFVERLGQLGVPHELQVWPVDIHVFQAATFLPEARDALRAVDSFLDGLAASRAGEEHAS